VEKMVVKIGKHMREETVEIKALREMYAKAQEKNASTSRTRRMALAISVGKQSQT
jgi:hypothetical protein